MNKLTLEWLKEQNACEDGIQWWKEHKESGGIKTLQNLLKDNKQNYANWLIVRLMTHEQCIKYAIYAAELVIGNYEKEYPNDDRPRKAIEVAKEYLKYPDDEHKKAAYYAANAANSAAYAAYPAANAAISVANAAISVANAAYSAAYAANYAANYAAYPAANYAAALIEIIEYGISLLEE